MFKHTKPLADALTVTRAVLGLCIAALGLTQGRDALPTVMLILIASWLSDLVDGPLARRDPESHTNWVGEHDAEADLATSLGVAVYLVLSGYLAAWVGAGLVVSILLLWILHSHQLAWPCYALPYVILLGLALRDAPAYGWFTILYLGVTLVLRWRRLRQEFLPQFFAAVSSLRLGHHNGSGENGTR
jgi:hypothetical protein